MPTDTGLLKLVSQIDIEYRDMAAEVYKLNGERKYDEATKARNDVCVRVYQILSAAMREVSDGK